MFMYLVNRIRKRVLHFLIRNIELSWKDVSDTAGLKPYKVFHSITSSGDSIAFEVIKDRRRYLRPPYWDYIFSKYLLHVRIHNNLPEKLKNFNNYKLGIVRILWPSLYSDDVIADVLVDIYLDRMLEVLEKNEKTAA